MNRSDTLSPLSRSLTYLSSVLYLSVGLTMFLAPAWVAPDFGWKVSPFVAMTIGAWLLGNGAMAFESARDWRWSVVHPALAYLWAFAIADTAVFLYFWEKVTLGSVSSTGYALALLVGLITALVGIVEAVTRRPVVTSVGAPIATWVRTGMIFFLIVTGILTIGGLLAPQGGLSTEGTLFPEKITLFTVRVFAVFFGALVIAGIPLMRSRGIAPLYFILRPGLVLITALIIAALVHIGAFDFAARPLGLAYFAAYLVTLIFALVVLQRYRGSAPLNVTA
jgi:hypothetical protein